MLLQLHVLEPRLYSCLFCSVFVYMDMAFCFFPLLDSLGLGVWLLWLSVWSGWSG